MESSFDYNDPAMSEFMSNPFQTMMWHKHRLVVKYSARDNTVRICRPEEILAFGFTHSTPGFAELYIGKYYGTADRIGVNLRLKIHSDEDQVMFLKEFKVEIAEHIKALKTEEFDAQLKKNHAKREKILDRVREYLLKPDSQSRQVTKA